MKTAKIKYDGQYFDVRVNDDLSVELPSGQILKEEQVEWLPPANGTMFALGLNYADHARELAFEPPKEPLIFIKANNTYIGHNKQTWRPDHVDYMHYECELVAVIGKTAKTSNVKMHWNMCRVIRSVMIMPFEIIWKTITVQICV